MSYFKPLRRKIGLISLALARLFAVWRMRSGVYGDEFRPFNLTVKHHEAEIIFPSSLHFVSFVPLCSKSKFIFGVAYSRSEAGKHDCFPK